MGNVRITSVGGFIGFRGPTRTTCRTTCGQQSNTGPGDSGGPMMYRNELVSITSGGAGTSSSNVNLNSRSSRDFIDTVEQIIGQSINYYKKSGIVTSSDHTAFVGRLQTYLLVLDRQR